VNPDETYADTEFADYVKEGVVAALNQVEAITGSGKIQAAGYCVGGTLLGIAQAYLAELGDDRLVSATFLTTLFDFSEPGEVGTYISGTLLPLLEQNVNAKGYLDGRVLALSFSLLRENNLFWSFFIENYLKGKDPMPFDILYWNSDSTNLPARAYLYYLNNMYVNNHLKDAGRLEIDHVPIDLSQVNIPAYCLAARADHIVLWQAAYKSAKLLKGPVRFVLTESGHVAGVINPASSGKYPHWVAASLPNKLG
jgi:polyhydroxyalkanoate synthase subunit PhaC